jgi:hypothetical protein
MDLVGRRPLALLAALMTLALALLTLHAPAQAAAGQTGSRTDTSGFFTGKVVNQANGNAVKGVTVKVFRINSDTLLGEDKTNANGRYDIEGLDPVQDEELDVRVNGRAVGFETGWVGCSNKVVQSWALSCSHGQGRQTRFFLQRS